MLGFDNNSLKYLLYKLKEKFVPKSSLNTKVSKDGNKILSSNDFTNEYKQILDVVFDDVDLEYTEDKNVILKFYSNGVEVGRVIYKC
jgi:hypothetical protein